MSDERLERIESTLRDHGERLHRHGNRITALEGQAREFLPREAIRDYVETGFARRLLASLNDEEVERRLGRLIADTLSTSGVLTEERFRGWLLAFFAGLAALVGLLSYLK